MAGRDRMGKWDTRVRDKAYVSIKNAIITGALKPNQRIAEAAMAARIGTSREPVRKALQKLEIEGVLCKHPKGGFVIKESDVASLQCTPKGYAEVVKNSAPLRDKAYVSIKNAIISGALKPNQRVTEETMAARIGASRTPVREALQKLEIEGLIFKKQAGGFLVKGVIQEEIEDIIGLQCILEGYAGRLAISRMTEEELCALDRLIELQEESIINLDVGTFIRLDSEFHARIHRAAKNVRLYELVQSLRDILDRYRSIIFRSHASLHRSVRDHKELVAVMRARNARKLEKLIGGHITRGKNVMKKNLTLS